MPKSVLQFNPAGTLTPEDVLYLIQGTGLDRDRKVTLEVVRAWMNGLVTVPITLAGDDTVDYTLVGNGNTLVVLSGFSATPYTLTITGTPPIPGQETIIANASAGIVTLSGAILVPSIVRILPGESARLTWNSPYTASASVGSTEASIVGRFVTTVLERDAYVSDAAEIGPTGSVPLIRGGVLYEASTEDLRGQGYQIPQSGNAAMKLIDAESGGSATNGYNYTRGIIRCETVRSVASASKRWSLTWNGQFGAEIVTSARLVKLQWSSPTVVTSTADKMAQQFHSQFTDLFMCAPVSFCFSRDDSNAQMAKSLTGYVRAGGAAGEVLWFYPLNSDGSQLTYAQLVTFMGDGGLHIRISAEGNS